MRRCGAVALSVVSIAGPCACGGSGPRADPAAEARVVAETNAACRALPSAIHGSQSQIIAFQHRLFVALTKLLEVSAYLPAGRDLNAAHLERRALFAAERKRGEAGLPRRQDFAVRLRRLQLRVYRDELALGLTCRGIAPEADRLARLLVIK